MQKWPPRPSEMTQNRHQKQPQMTLKRFYQHLHSSLQPPRYTYADLRHEVCGAGVHACVFNIYRMLVGESKPGNLIGSCVRDPVAGALEFD